jgi:hypothetical protein
MFVISKAVVTLDRLKLHASPAMGEGPCICELPIGSELDIMGGDVGGRDDPVCLPAATAHELGYVHAAHIRFM